MSGDATPRLFWCLGLLGSIACVLAACAAPAAAPTVAPTIAAAPAVTQAPAVAAATAPAAAPTTAVRPAPLGKTRFAVQPSTGYSASYLAADRGYFAEEGVEFEFVPFANASEMVPALATGQVETAGIAANPATWNAMARGVRMRLTLEQTSFRPGYGTNGLFIRREVYDAGRGRSLADLRGLTIAFTPPGKGTSNACAMAPAMQRVGASIDDFEIVNLGFPDMVAALANGAIDGGVISEPFGTRTVRQGSAVRVMGQDEMYPNFSLSMVAFSEELYANRPLARAYARAYIRGSRAYLAAVSGQSGEADRADVDAILARHTGLTPEVLRESIPVGLNPNGFINQESVRFCYGWFRDQGLVPEPVPQALLDAMWGDDVVEEALQSLGRVAD